MPVEPIPARDDPALGAALRALPRLQPPDDGWARLQAALEAEARTQRLQRRRRRWWRTGIALAATIALAALLLPQHLSPPSLPAPAADPATTSAAIAAADDAAARGRLIDESARLEALLNWMRPGSENAESLALDLALVDRLQWIDHLLADPGAGDATREVLWRERVDLLQQRVVLHQRDSLAAAGTELALTTTL